MPIKWKESNMLRTDSIINEEDQPKVEEKAPPKRRKRGENIEIELGIDDGKVLHIAIPEGATPEFKYKVRSPEWVDSYGKYHWLVSNQYVGIREGLLPNPIYFDVEGLSEFLTEGARDNLLEAGYTEEILYG